MNTLGNIRGWRNNNPGNIRLGEKWIGLTVRQDDSSFCRFCSPEYGIRAIAKILQTYYHKHKLTTIRAIINRWAPPSENNTEAYIHHVCQRVGTADFVELTLGIDHYLHSLTKAIIHHELGCQPYSDWLIDTGISWAINSIPKNNIH